MSQPPAEPAAGHVTSMASLGAMKSSHDLSRLHLCYHDVDMTSLMLGSGLHGKTFVMGLSITHGMGWKKYFEVILSVIPEVDCCPLLNTV